MRGLSFQEAAYYRISLATISLAASRADMPARAAAPPCLGGKRRMRRRAYGLICLQTPTASAMMPAMAAASLWADRKRLLSWPKIRISSTADIATLAAATFMQDARQGKARRRRHYRGGFDDEALASFSP